MFHSLQVKDNKNGGFHSLPVLTHHHEVQQVFQFWSFCLFPPGILEVVPSSSADETAAVCPLLAVYHHLTSPATVARSSITRLPLSSSVFPSFFPLRSCSVMLNDVHAHSLCSVSPLFLPALSASFHVSSSSSSPPRKPPLWPPPAELLSHDTRLAAW